MTIRILSLAVVAAAAVGCTHRTALVRDPAVVTTIPVAQIVLAERSETLPTTHTFPRYPMALQNDGTPGRVLAVFVIDTVGQIDLRSVHFELDANRFFDDAVCQALKHTRFAPVRRDGQARPALILMPVSFTMGEDTAAARSLVPDAEPYRASIRAEGMDAALARLAQRPGC